MQRQGKKPALRFLCPKGGVWWWLTALAGCVLAGCSSVLEEDVKNQGGDTHACGVNFL